MSQPKITPQKPVHVPRGGLGWVGFGLGVREREKKGKRTKPVVQRRQELGLFEVLAAEHAVNVGAGNLDLVVVLLCSSL